MRTNIEIPVASDDLPSSAVPARQSHQQARKPYLAKALTSDAPQNRHPVVRPRRVFQFAAAGATGFMVDATVLSLLTSLAGWQPLRARLLSFLSAVTITWLLNRRYAFADQRARRHVSWEYSRYLLVQILGAMLNYLVFALVLVLLPALNAHPVRPLAAGSAVAMFFNYFSIQHWAFSENGRLVCVNNRKST